MAESKRLIYPLKDEMIHSEYYKWKGVDKIDPFDKFCDKFCI